MSNGTTTEQRMNYTQDIREAIKILRETIGFDYVKSVNINIDNSLYNDLYGDEVYPFVNLIDSNLTDVNVTIDDECFILLDTIQHELTKIPLSAISDINYLYNNNCFYLFFNIYNFYNVCICFTNPQ